MPVRPQGTQTQAPVESLVASVNAVSCTTYVALLVPVFTSTTESSVVRGVATLTGIVTESAHSVADCAEGVPSNGTNGPPSNGIMSQRRPAPGRTAAARPTNILWPSGDTSK